MSKTEDNGTPELDSSKPLDILRMRAEARALLNDPDRLPVMFMVAVSPVHDADGTPRGGICDPGRAIMQIPGAPDREFLRESGEDLEAFKERVCRELPVRYEGRELWADRGGPGLNMYCISLLPRKD